MRLADLFVGIKADTADLKKELNTLPGNMSAAGKKGAAGFTGQIKQSMASLKTSMKNAINPQALATAGVMGGVAAFGALAAGIGGAIKSLIEIERLGAQTNAAIRSTGGVANVTRKQVDELAGSIENLSGVEAESITEGQNLLLTFTNVRNEAGKGNDIFDQATESMVDYSVAMGTDAKSAALQLGKALNDPVKGLTALSKAGVQFTEAQRDMIEEMVTAGDVMGAQKIILAELTKQFGGSAEAFGNTTAGKLQKAQNTIGSIFEAIVLDAAGAADEFGGAAFDMAANFGDMGDRVHAIAEAIGVDFTTLKERIRAEMFENGKTFEEALLIAEQALSGIPLAATDAGMRSLANWKQADLGGVMVNDIEGAAEGMAGALGAAPDMMADALLANQFELTGSDGAIAKLVDFMDQALTPAQERFNAQAFLSSQEYQDGLNSGIPSVVLKAEEMAAEARAVLANADFYSAAANAAFAFGNGLVDPAAIAFVQRNASRLAAAARGIFPGSEPKDRRSPLRGITKAFGFSEILAGGILGGKGAVADAMRHVSAAMVPRMSDLKMSGVGGIGGASLSAPRRSVATAVQGVSGAVGGDTYVTNNITIDMIDPPNSPAGVERLGNAIGAAVDRHFIRTGRFPRRSGM